MKPEWRKSSFSGDQGECVEVAFVKSSFSTDADCVEVGFVGPITAVRDSKNPAATLSLPLDHWQGFLGYLD